DHRDRSSFPTRRSSDLGFRLGGQASADEELQNWWEVNNLDVESSLVHLGSLIYGDSYVTISRPDPNDPDHEPGVPVIRRESPERSEEHTSALQSREKLV